jgi:trans-aconitate methyltransferase
LEEYRPTELFDAVFSNAVLHWIKTPETAVKAVQSLLRRGGRFVSELGGGRNLGAVLGALNDAALSVLGRPFASPWYFPGLGAYASLLDQHGFETSLATLIHRPTPLQGEDGLRSWLRMYLPGLLESLSVSLRAAFLDEVESALRPHVYLDGAWWLDHYRLRFFAIRI